MQSSSDLCFEGCGEGVAVSQCGGPLMTTAEPKFIQTTSLLNILMFICII